MNRRLVDKWIFCRCNKTKVYLISLTPPADVGGVTGREHEAEAGAERRQERPRDRQAPAGRRGEEGNKYFYSPAEIFLSLNQILLRITI